MLKTIILLFVLLLDMSLGVISRYLGKASYTYGFPLELGLLFLCFIIFINGKIGKQVFLMMLFMMLIIFQTAVSYYVLGFSGFRKSLFSLLLYTFTIFLAYSLYRLIYLVKERHLYLLFNSTAFFLFIIGFLSAMLQYFGFLAAKKVIILKEASHLAIIMAPFLLLEFFYFRKICIRLALVFSALLLVLLLKTATLLLIVGINFFLLLFITKRKSDLVITVVLMFVFLAFWKLLLPQEVKFYLVDRLTLNTESSLSNLSALAYISGWERAFLSLKKTYILGLGFNRLGFFNLKGHYQQILSSLGFADLNLYDGATLGAKIIAELGGLGLLLLLIYFIILIKLLISVANARVTIRDLFFLSCYISFSFELLVRGFGYFTPNTIFFFASCMWVWKFFRQLRFEKYHVKKIIT